MVKALQGVENVYTQHAPLLSETLRLLASNDLSTASYPYSSEAGVSLQTHAHIASAMGDFELSVRIDEVWRIESRGEHGQ